MSERFAVIDLGTNTFHILIAEAQKDGSFREIFRERRFVKLAEDGIETIGAGAFDRGLATLQDYKAQLDKYRVSNLRAFGTAALRTASNGPAFVAAVLERTGIAIQLISGDEEARLIHLGVLQAINFSQERFLIMDIGGGSVEFIIADKDQVFWSQSFPIGVAVLHGRFHHSEPINDVEIQNVETFLLGQLNPLKQALTNFPSHVLVGASGTFDVLENILPNTLRDETSSIVQLEHFPTFYQKMLNAPLEERLMIEGIPPARAEMLVVALILINLIIEMADIDAIQVSAYAMKEGILYEMMRK